MRLVPPKKTSGAMASTTAKLKQKLRRAKRRGLTQTAVKAWHDHVFRIERDIVMSLDLDRARFGPVQPGGEYKSHEILDLGSPAYIRLASAFPQKAKYFAEYLNTDCVIFSLEKDDRPVGFFIVALSDFYDRYYYRRLIKVGDHSAYMFSVFITPSARSRAAAWCLGKGGLSALQEMGRKEIRGSVSTRIPSIRRLYRLFGARETGEQVLFYKLFVWRWSRLVPSADEPVATPANPPLQPATVPGPDGQSH